MNKLNYKEQSVLIGLRFAASLERPPLPNLPLLEWQAIVEKLARLNLVKLEVLRTGDAGEWNEFNWGIV